MRPNLATGVLCIALAVVFWFELDVDNPLGAVFPKLVLAVLAVLGVVLVVLGLVRREPADEARGPRRLRVFVLSLCVLFAWSVMLGFVGFTISGVAAFLATTWIIRRGRFAVRTVAMDVGVAIVLVVACALLFMRVLHVPLPVSTVLGI
ncbi:MAG: tripartite tricarboxylate transporter TctB family protein [Streptosporangiales bacterium]